MHAITLIKSILTDGTFDDLLDGTIYTHSKVKSLGTFPFVVYKSP